MKEFICEFELGKRDCVECKKRFNFTVCEYD